MGSRIEKSFLPVFLFYRAGKGGDKRWPSHQIEHGWSFCAPQDVKKKHLSLRRKGTRFLTSSSRPVAAIRSAVSLGNFLFMLLVASAGTLAPTSGVVAFGQPWFYLRLGAYRFIGLSEEAYGRSRDSRPEPHFRILILEPVARSWRRNAGHQRFRSDDTVRSSCLWFYMFGVERFSFLPDLQRNGGDLPRQCQPGHFRSYALGQHWF
jgi:hypothetical protein